MTIEEFKKIEKNIQYTKLKEIYENEIQELIKIVNLQFNLPRIEYELKKEKQQEFTKYLKTLLSNYEDVYNI